MKNTVLISFLSLLIALSPGCGAAPTNSMSSRVFVVGVSPFLSAAERQTAHEYILSLVLDRAGTGDIIDVRKGFQDERVVRLVIPEGRQFQKNPRARAVRFQEELSMLGTFFSTNLP